MFVSALILSILVLLALFLPNIFLKIQFFGYAILIYCIIKICRLKHIDYENSGEVLSLKSHRIFNKKLKNKQIEIPLESIINVHAQKSIWYIYLVIKIRKDGQRFKIIHFPCSHLKLADLQLIEEDFKLKDNIS